MRKPDDPTIAGLVSARTLDSVTEEANLIETDRANAERDLRRLRDARPPLLLDLTDEGEAKIEAHDSATARQSRRLERLVERLTALKAEQARFVEDAEQARRRDLYATGEAAMAEYRRIAVEDYARAAGALADVLASLQIQEGIVDTVNRQLPAGKPPIDLGPLMYGVGTWRRTTSLDFMIMLPGPLATDPWIWSLGHRP